MASVATATVPRRALLIALAVTFAATVVGLFVLWPEGPRPTSEYAADGVTFPHAEVLSLGPSCPVTTDGSAPRVEGCGKVTVELAGGEQVTVGVPPGVPDSGLRKGDTVELLRIPGEPGGDPIYAWSGTLRGHSLAVLAVAFVLVVGLVAGLRGLLAILGLGFAGAVIWWFMLPALLAGSPAPAVALVASSTIMIVVLYLAHGLTMRTSAALGGTMIGVLITAGIGWWAVGASRLGGVADEAGEILRTQAPQLDFRGLLIAAIIIAGLGVLNDVTITQSSAVWELRAVSPDATRRELYTSAMRIGRDHIASTIYTIVFAYAGTALVILILVSLYDRTLLERLVDEGFGEEIVRTLASAIGLVLAVPVTTAIAVAVVQSPRRDRPEGRRIRR
ncbi:YibE/F family protein [Nocardioides cavernaquae]|uniref:YibE/F family protein n=1 Tax=Nocardioides cavernaquae TaxID=2321396 RepID=UPI001EE5C64A|nr:YibE/F family protein [Nocardioides cavernaquae]